MEITDEPFIVERKRDREGAIENDEQRRSEQQFRLRIHGLRSNVRTTLDTFLSHQLLHLATY